MCEQKHDSVSLRALNFLTCVKIATWESAVFYKTIYIYIMNSNANL